MKDLKHGHVSTYTNYACRCDDCRQAHTDYTRERRRALKENPKRVCDMSNCDSPHYAKGYCQKHHLRVLKTGTPYRIRKGLSYGGKKHCYSCDQIKSVDEFYKNRSRADGLTRMCKECRKEYSREYYKNNKAKFQRYWQEQYAKHGDKHRARNIRYYWDNKIKALVNYHNRKARESGAEGVLTEEELFRLFNKSHFSCLKCGGPPGVDHVVPYSQGGTNNIDNIQSLCRPCNSEKHDSTTDYRK